MGFLGELEGGQEGAVCWLWLAKGGITAQTRKILITVL